jgi:hypothetical protein
VRKNEAPGPCDIRELRECSCQGLEQHHQDTTLKFGATPDGPSRSAYLHWEQAKALAAAIVAVLLVTAVWLLMVARGHARNA